MRNHFNLERFPNLQHSQATSLPGVKSLVLFFPCLPRTALLLLLRLSYKTRSFPSVSGAAQLFHLIYSRISHVGSMLNIFEAALQVRRMNPPVSLFWNVLFPEVASVCFGRHDVGLSYVS